MTDGFGESNDPDEIDFKKILSDILSAKWIIFFLVIISIVFFSIFIRFQKYEYLITLNVVPVEKDQDEFKTSSLQKLATSVTGVDLGKETNSFNIYKSLLKSMEMARNIENDKDFFKFIYASYWNSEKNIWEMPNSSNFSSFKNFIKNLLGIPIPPNNVAPNHFGVYKFLNQNIFISSSEKTGITSIRIYSSKPTRAIKILNYIHKEADNIIKERNYVRALENVDFLTEQLENTPQKDLRMSIISSLSLQQRNLMTSKSDLSYVAEPLGKPYSSELPVRPRHTFLLIIFVVSGFALGIIVSIYRGFKR